MKYSETNYSSILYNVLYITGLVVKFIVGFVCLSDHSWLQQQYTSINSLQLFMYPVVNNKLLRTRLVVKQQAELPLHLSPCKYGR